LALALSAMAQLFGVVGLLLVPIGAFWLVYELRKRVVVKMIQLLARVLLLRGSWQQSFGG
jgi:hypothetical protein